MDINNPFETFERSAFRLEALPQYLVENEKEAFRDFKESGVLPGSFGSEWAELVSKNIQTGKSMQRLRLLSDELSDYEQFEIKVYSGISVGEDIRAALRAEYISRYEYDFWLFDSYWIAQVVYEGDGTFVRIDMREATNEELEKAEYWIDVFNQSKNINDYLALR